MYHAAAKDPQTAEHTHNLARVPEASRRARVTTRIHPHKFVVRSRVQEGGRVPHAVLCGSVNFTENGVSRQANVVHVAQADLDLLEMLSGGAALRATRAYIGGHNPLPASWADGFAGFSPGRGGELDLEAFDLAAWVLDALWGKEGDDLLRLGLQNRRQEQPEGVAEPGGDIVGTHRDRGRQFAGAALLPDGLEGFSQENTAGPVGNILIHTKLVVFDFTTDSPTVISGSHNFSKNGGGGNDENHLVLRGDTWVADVYGCGLLLIYNHYRFRRLKEEGATAAPRLATTDA